MIVDFDHGSMEDYAKFLRLKKCPQYSWKGESAIVPDEYAAAVTGTKRKKIITAGYSPSPFLFDYQRDITALAIRKQKFAVFADCGLGKTLILLEFAREVYQRLGGRVLIVSPLMVCHQTIQEAERWYPRMAVTYVPSSKLQEWMQSGEGIAITNYEAITDEISGVVNGLILDESSMLKSHYGAWGLRLIEIGRGVPYKLALTGTPAPNDRVEYANHAVFLDHFRTVNEFMARYFVNKGQTQERWILRAHALKPFYRDLSHWCVFLTNPATYGWKDNCGTIPPIHVHLHHVELTAAQRKAVQEITGGLMVSDVGGIGERGKLAQLAKGFYRDNPIDTNKPGFIRGLMDSWKGESSLIWCRHNPEQDAMAELFKDRAVSIDGATPQSSREKYIAAFKAREVEGLISKPRILGFGLNLQVATRQIFNAMQDSYEEYYQAVKRSNRVGSDKPLNVHIPFTEIEEPMVSNVLRKADRVQADTQEQEALFKEMAWTF